MMETRAITAEETHPLRRLVLRDGRADADVVFAGDDSPGAFHAGVYIDQRMVGIASMQRDDRPSGQPHEHAGSSWRLRGMATVAEARRQGVGAAAVEACVQHAMAQGGTYAWCNARMVAVPFYEAQGWKVVSDEFDIPGIGPHVVMDRLLEEPAHETGC